MKHNFKPGDRAYWITANKWITLENSTHANSRDFPLKNKEGDLTFTELGEFIRGDETPVLLPLNPYDPTDPLDLDPVMIAVLIACTLGAGILVPLIYSTLKIIGGQ